MVEVWGMKQVVEVGRNQKGEGGSKQWWAVGRKQRLEVGRKHSDVGRKAKVEVGRSKGYVCWSKQRV